MAKRHTTKTSKNRSNQVASPKTLPFIEHLHELRRRLFIVAVSIGIGSSLAYAVEHHIVDWLLQPAHGEKFIYTAVGGGIDFLFRVCLYTGILFSIPVILYQVLRYLQPLLRQHSLRFIFLMSGTSALLAIAGVAFGYYLGLPSALQFLLHQFGAENISALITIQSYLSFVILYLVGSSLLFQVPLILFIINRIKPLKIKPLLKYERWVILISFIIGAMINPSPRIYDMTILAVPMILSYQIGILLVWLTNRKHFKPKHIQTLLEKDEAARAERLEKLAKAKRGAVITGPTPKLAPVPEGALAAIKPVYAASPRRSATADIMPMAAISELRSQKYANAYIDMRPARRVVDIMSME
ncbi:MAG: twin-arginine translocase subunit TatC [Candidatus Saccharimonadales bacterium]